jgi:predicted HAD superfamily Cof-like phosphohydrolase
MEKQIKQVLEFYDAFGHPKADSPRYIPTYRMIMRHNILNEEVCELLDAGVKGDLAEVGDAITDCFYILIGTAIEFGVAHKLTAMFDEVHKSNMSKLGEDGKPIYREDGKVMKGPNYKKPNLKDIIYDKTP